MKLLNFIFIYIAIFNTYTHAADTTSAYAHIAPTAHQDLIFSMPEHPSVFSYGPEKHQEINRKLINTPYDYHQECIANLTPIFKEMMASHALLSQHLIQEYLQKGKTDHELIRTAQQKNPLFFLQECTKCDLKRNPIKNACPKEAFTKDILNSMPRLEEPMNVLFYAAGHCFWEMELTARIIERGNKIQKIILIDPDFKNLVNRFMSQKLISFDSISKNDTITRKSCYHLIEMLYFMAHHNPKINIIIYDSYNKYMLDAQTNPELKNHLITALDYQDDPSNLNVALDKELEALFNETTKPKGLLCKIDSVSTREIKHKANN